MRAFAEFVMRGRTQAVAVSVLGVGSMLFVWVSAATVALVTLRKGGTQGGIVLLWTLLPALVIAVMGRDIGPAAAVTGAAFAALALRSSASWTWALAAATLSGFVTAVLMSTLGAEQLAAIMEVLQRFMDKVQQEGNAAAAMALPSATAVAGLIGLSNVGSVLVSLLLARWWQSLLYNPGGFQREMHSLRLPQSFVLALAGVGLLLVNAGDDYRLWSTIVTAPLLVAGLCLAHGVVGLRKMSGSWLVMLYLALLMLDGMRVVLMMVAVLDSWINFRGRLQNNQPPQQK